MKPLPAASTHLTQASLHLGVEAVVRGRFVARTELQVFRDRIDIATQCREQRGVRDVRGKHAPGQEEDSESLHEADGGTEAHGR